MVNIYERRFTVSAELMDDNQHVNNVEYIRLMQEVAIEHSHANGGSVLLEPLGVTWVARSHAIQYRRPAVRDDEIRLRTWICEIGRASATRRFEFVRDADDVVLAHAETVWVLIDTETGSSKRIPQQLRECFSAVTP